MAKEQTPGQLKREYEALAAKTARFVSEDKVFIHRMETEYRKALDERKAQRAKLMAEKLAAFTAWKQAGE